MGTANLCYGTGDKVNPVCAMLIQAACCILVTTVLSVGGKADFSMLVINIKFDTTGGEILHCNDNKNKYSRHSIDRRQGPNSLHFTPSQQPDYWLSVP